MVLISINWIQRLRISACRSLCIFVAFGFWLTPLEAQEAENSQSSSYSAFPLPASREMLEVYLRFHEEELCKGIDAVFVPDGNGMDIWCRVEDKGQYKKFLKIMESSSGLGRITTYAVLPLPDEKSDEDDPPPSLWENEELRRLFHGHAFVIDSNPDSQSTFAISPEDLYKQRLLLFSEETLKESRALEREAGDLPILTRIALDISTDPDLRESAKKICREHAKNLEKQAGKLEDNLKQALPNWEDDSSDDEPIVMETLPDLSVQIAENARSISRRIHSFIYPDLYTVKVEELRNPGLIYSLRLLQELGSRYRDKMDREIP
jgi:hypothetical protein